MAQVYKGGGSGYIPTPPKGKLPTDNRTGQNQTGIGNKRPTPQRTGPFAGRPKGLTPPGPLSAGQKAHFATAEVSKAMPKVTSHPNAMPKPIR
jgi:hypothetical protein